MHQTDIWVYIQFYWGYGLRAGVSYKSKNYSCVDRGAVPQTRRGRMANHFVKGTTGFLVAISAAMTKMLVSVSNNAGETGFRIASYITINAGLFSKDETSNLESSRTIVYISEVCYFRSRELWLFILRYQTSKFPNEWVWKWHHVLPIILLNFIATKYYDIKLNRN